MTCTSCNNQKMSCRASAFCANAASFCANFANTAVVDAILVASIIVICALLGLFVLGISLVLLVVLLYFEKMNMPRAQKFLQAV